MTYLDYYHYDTQVDQLHPRGQNQRLQDSPCQVLVALRWDIFISTFYPTRSLDSQALNLHWQYLTVAQKDQNWEKCNTWFNRQTS